MLCAVTNTGESPSRRRCHRRRCARLFRRCRGRSLVPPPKHKLGRRGWQRVCHSKQHGARHVTRAASANFEARRRAASGVEAHAHEHLAAHNKEAQRRGGADVLGGEEAAGRLEVRAQDGDGGGGVDGGVISGHDEEARAVGLGREGAGGHFAARQPQDWECVVLRRRAAYDSLSLSLSLVSNW